MNKNERMESLLCDVDEGKKEAVKQSIEDTFEEFPLFVRIFSHLVFFFFPAIPLLSLPLLLLFDWCMLVYVLTCGVCQRWVSFLH